MSRVAEVLGAGLARALPGHEQRPQQIAVAEAVARALADEQPLLVEAGTGTGKTLAYLVPALLSGKRVVISTGTKNLQEQIFHKDVPLLRRMVDLPFEATVLKGISNYVCLRRLAEAQASPATAGMGGPIPHDPDIHLAEIATFARTSTTGDRADLPTVPDDSPTWKLVTTTPDARLGPKCPFFERCFVTQARRAAAKADLVIVNHHLFFADLALRAAWPGAQVIPPYDAVVFDEAHQIEEIATEHFGRTVSTLRLAALVRDARKAIADAPQALDNLERRGHELFRAVRARLRLGDAAPDGTRVATPPDLFAAEDVRDAWFHLDAALEEVALHAFRAAMDARDDDEDEDLAAVKRRAEAFRTDLATVAEPSRGQGASHVHWTELRGRSVLLHASPVDVAPLLRDHLFSTTGAVIFTSATLTAGGSFAYTRSRLGLAEAHEASELVVDSPFDYPSQALLYVPRDLPLPDAPGFAEEATARIEELLAITEGRAFVLFTSWRSLRTVATRLRAAKKHRLLVQGEATRGALLDDFRKNVGSVLLATSSFWEGVDVPGEALSLVILEKLPFAPPDEPLTAARAQRLEDGAFSEYILPRAALALKQGFGRLIRRRDDRGIVAILDGRIVTRSYGRVFLDTLPPAARTSSIEQARRWWAAPRSGSVAREEQRP